MTMIVCAGVAGVVLATLTALWIRNRQLHEEVQQLRALRATDWILTAGRLGAAVPPPTPEQRRRNFYVVKGGGATALLTLLANHLIEGRDRVRAHPAMTAATLTAVVAGAVILSIALLRSGTSTPHTPRPPVRSAPASPTAPRSSRSSAPATTAVPSGGLPPAGVEEADATAGNRGGPSARPTPSEESVTPSSQPAASHTASSTPSLTDCLLRIGVGRTVAMNLCLADLRG